MKKTGVLFCIIVFFITACSTHDFSYGLDIKRQDNKIYVLIKPDVKAELVEKLKKGFSATILLKVEPQKKNAGAFTAEKAVFYNKKIVFYKIYGEYRIISGQTIQSYKDEAQAISDFLSFPDVSLYADKVLSVTVKLNTIDFKGAFSIIPEFLRRDSVYKVQYVIGGDVK